MSPEVTLPAGFEALEAAGGLLIGESSLMPALVERGLNDPAVWQRLLSAAPSGVGRGTTAGIELPAGRRLVLKKLLRGGIAGRLRRESFTGTGRLLANISTPLEAAERGIPTPAPAALLMVPGPPGCYRAWLAVEEIAGASDLSTILDSSSVLSKGETAAVMRLVRRMHDRGLDHRDLNLGNLLLRPAAAGKCQAFIIDLDKARLIAGELPFRRRLAALFRLERSYVKQIERSGARACRGELDRWYELYAEEDRRLAARLACWRWLIAPVLLVHRMGWIIARQL
jgi:3-deoxy-D-manno-octulosonic acid kinase